MYSFTRIVLQLTRHWKAISPSLRNFAHNCELKICTWRVRERKEKMYQAVRVKFKQVG